MKTPMPTYQSSGEDVMKQLTQTQVLLHSGLAQGTSFR